jgi:cellobiose-specific phosphotransferase system component IIC
MKVFILSLCRVLLAGESLADPATWKNRQQRVNALMTLAMVAAPLLPMLRMTADDVLTIVEAVGIVGGLINGYLTVATTDKIGFGGSRGES